RVGAGWCREAGSTGRYPPAINRSAIDRQGHGLARLVDPDENIGNGWLACRASEAQPEQRQGNKPKALHPSKPPSIATSLIYVRLWRPKGSLSVIGPFVIWRGA